METSLLHIVEHQAAADPLETQQPDSSGQGRDAHTAVEYRSSLMQKAAMAGSTPYPSSWIPTGHPSRDGIRTDVGSSGVLGAAWKEGGGGRAGHRDEAE